MLEGPSRKLRIDLNCLRVTEFSRDVIKHFIVDFQRCDRVDDTWTYNEVVT